MSEYHLDDASGLLEFSGEDMSLFFPNSWETALDSDGQYRAFLLFNFLSCAEFADMLAAYEEDMQVWDAYKHFVDGMQRGDEVSPFAADYMNAPTQKVNRDHLRLVIPEESTTD